MHPYEHFLGLGKFRRPWRHQLTSLLLHFTLMPLLPVYGYYVGLWPYLSTLKGAFLVAGVWELFQVLRDTTSHPNLLDRSRDILHSLLGASVLCGQWPDSLLFATLTGALWTTGLLLSRTHPTD